jgi:hypothetical protein
MKIQSILCLAVLMAASLAAIPARAGELLPRNRRAAEWNTNNYDPAWGMPVAVVVPPRAKWQVNYASGVGGTRWNRVGSQYHAEFPGPESAYNQRNFLPAPPQPSNTQQFGVNYVRGPRR